MSTVTAHEAESHFADLLERVSKGEEIVVMRDDEPCARIIPERRKSRKQVRAAVAGLRALQDEIEQRTHGEPLSYAEYRAALEEGRE